jgi:hypothetical protein
VNPHAQQIRRRLVLERYVLGTLEEDARAVLRAQVIADPNVFAEIREIELDLLDAAARDTLAAGRDVAAARQRLAAARPLPSAGTRRAWTLSTALAVRTSARERPAPDAPSPLPLPSQSRAPRRGWTAASLWTQVRIWPAAAVWLAIAIVSLRLSQGAAPDSATTPARLTASTSSPADSAAAPPPAPVTAADAVANVPNVPDAGAPSAPAAARAAADASTRASFLRIDLTLSGGRLNAIVTSPSGMFAGVWSLEIDSGTERHSVPVTGRHP